MFHQKISVFHIHPESFFKVHSKPSVDFVRITILRGYIGGRGVGSEKVVSWDSEKKYAGFLFRNM